MKQMQSATFKTNMLLGYGAGEEVSIVCQSWRDCDSKAAACRLFKKRHPEKFQAMGVESLTVRKVGNNVVLVRLNPIGKVEN